MLRFLLILQCGLAAFAQPNAAFLERIEQVVKRPEYRHSRFGMEIYSLDDNKAIYQLNEQEFFSPGSTAKLLSTGAALTVLGPDYRFHTRVYRTGALEDGTVKGDLVLVASGDPNLSNRIRPDGTLAFENDDHSYAGTVVPGDPLMVLRLIARQIVAKGIHKITGRVWVDARLFPEGTRETGTQTVISPISLNDNLIDVTVSPTVEGAPAKLEVSPQTSYLKIVNQTQTIAAGGEMTFHWGRDEKQPDGTHNVIAAGNIPVRQAAALHPYRVPEPSVFAGMALSQALREEGVLIEAKKSAVPPDFKSLSAGYTAANQVAEHVSAPLTEAVKVILKVSQNLHASMLPYMVGVTSGSSGESADQAGFDQEKAWLDKAGLDSGAVAQSLGATAYGITPDLMVHYLAYMSGQKYFAAFRSALPVLGKDGSLWDIQVNSPAVDHVFAKTGTGSSRNLLGRNAFLNAKGLAGYIRTKSGRNLAFAVYANNIPGNPDTVAHIVGDALGEIAAAAYECF